MLIFIWKQPYYYYIAVVIASFLVGALILDFTKSIIYTSASLVIGSFISVGIIIAPGLLYGADRMIIDANILYYTKNLAQLLLISLPLCIFVVMAGVFVGEILRRR